MASAVHAEHATTADTETTGELAGAVADNRSSLAPSELVRWPVPVIESGRPLVLRLALSFALLIVVMVGLGWWISWRIVAADAHLERNLRDRTAKVRMIYDVLHYSSENSRLIVEILLQKTLSPELLAHRVETSNQITALISALEANCDSEQEQKLVATVKSTRDLYVHGYRRALELDGKDNQLARVVVINDAAPALFVYHRALEDLAGFELQQMGVATDNASERDRVTRTIGLTLQWLAAFMAAAIALFTTRRIARDMAARNHMQNEVSMLNAQLEERVAERTEELARRDEQLRESLTESQEYAKDIEAVNELAQLLQSCLTLKEAEQQAARILSRFFPAGTVLLLNSSRSLMEVSLAWGPASSGRGPFQPESCWALRKGQVHLVGPHCCNPPCAHYEETVTGCHLCVPMIAQGASLGVLSIDDPNLCQGQPKSARLERKRKLAGTLAEQMSVTFANLRLHETLKYQSVRDPLTRLFNRRHMEEGLERELHRATRKATPVAVLMIDIDHFKRFNDSYGHDAGDLVLQEFGSLVQTQIRGGDLACRYGGEEFLLIMGETDLESARQRAEALREQVRAMPVRYRGQLLRRLTVSIGVAVFPAHASSGAQLISVADGALYRAKHEGRDRVVVAE